MGCFDVIDVPCPKCGWLYPAQSKSGPCELARYSLQGAPDEVFENVNRHAPFSCMKCGTLFRVRRYHQLRKSEEEPTEGT